MTGYEIYCYCRKLTNWSIPSIETYKNSKEYGFYEMLSNWSIKTKKYSSEEMRNYILIVYNNDKVTFDPYDLMNDKWEALYTKWVKTKSTKNAYLNTVKESFNYITNFCLKKNISLDKYKAEWAAKHIRQELVDGAVAVYLKLIDKKSLKPIHKILLKKYLSEYNIIVVRIKDPTLNELLASSTEEMKRILETNVSKIQLSNN